MKINARRLAALICRIEGDFGSDVCVPASPTTGVFPRAREGDYSPSPSRSISSSPPHFPSPADPAVVGADTPDFYPACSSSVPIHVTERRIAPSFLPLPSPLASSLFRRRQVRGGVDLGGGNHDEVSSPGGPSPPPPPPPLPPPPSASPPSSSGWQRL